MLTRRRILRIQNNLRFYVPFVVLGVVLMAMASMGAVQIIYGGNVWP